MRALGIALLFAFAGPAIADRDVPAALQPYMTEEEDLAAGLDKLNPAELAQFQAWFVRTLQSRREGAAPTRAGAAPAADAPTIVADETPRAGRNESERRFGNEQLENMDELTASVVGTFNGWDGPTRIELDNGQVWQTLGGSQFTTLRPMENAQVTITRGAFNSYRLKVEGYNRNVQVKRIE